MACVDDGRGGGEHGGYHIADVLLGGAGLADGDGLVVELAGELGGGDVAGELKQDGA